MVRLQNPNLWCNVLDGCDIKELKKRIEFEEFKGKVNVVTRLTHISQLEICNKEVNIYFGLDPPVCKAKQKARHLLGCNEDAHDRAGKMKYHITTHRR